MVKRDELLAAAKSSAESLVQFVQECKPQKGSCLSETIGSCSKKQIQEVWENTLAHLSDKLQYQGEDDVGQVSMELQANLNTMVAMLSATISQKDVYIPEPALAIALLLRDIMPTLPASEQKLKTTIAKLFEEWYQKNLPWRDDVILTSFVYLIEKSLEPKPKPVVADVKKVWSLHKVLTLVDFNNEESKDFMALLQRCFIYPKYLTQDEGIKFLAFVLSENEAFTKTLHSVLKEHLCAMNSGCYGVVYFRAWQQLKGDAREKFERDCLQDLMYHAVTGQQSIFPALKKLLHQIHLQKKQNGVDAMLLRLYEPFLWRALRAPNHKVRTNAATLFFDMFPLQSPEMGVKETDELLQKQFDFFQELLNDPFQSVRVVTVAGVFRVMKDYWETIPKQALRNLTLQLIQALHSEATAPEVREQVVKGVTLLLDNILSHVFLQPLLSQVGKALHDPAESVRKAMLELLIKVKGLRTIKYWHIVPVEHLLARLVVDSEVVNRRIVKLLFSSFLPLEASGSVQIQRLLVLIESNPAAVRQFFLYARNHMSITDAVNFLLTLCKAIVADMKQKTRGKENSSDSNVQDEDEEDKSLSPKEVQGLIEAACILWTASRDELKKECNAGLLKDLQKKFSFTLAEMMKVYSDPQILAAVVQIAGFLPLNYIPTISCKWVPILRNMTSASRLEDYSVVLETLVTSGGGHQVLDLALEWLQEALEKTDTLDLSCEALKKGQKKKKKKLRFAETQSPQPQLAVDFLTHLFKYVVTREKILQNFLPRCEILVELLGKVKEAIKGQLNGQPFKIADDAEKFLTTAFTLYCNLLPHLHSVDPEGHSKRDEILEVLAWTDKHVLPGIGVKEETDGGIQPNKLAVAIVQNVLQFYNGVLLVGLADASMCTQLVDFCTACMAVDEKLSLLPQVLLVLYQVTGSIQFLETDDSEPGFSPSVIPNALSRTLVTIAAYVKNHPEQSATLLASGKSLMVELTSAVFISPPGEDTAVLHEVTSTILASILAEFKFYSQQFGLEEEPTMATLPPLSCWLLDILQQRKPILGYIIEELQDCCESDVVSDVHSCHGVAHLICALVKMKKKPTELAQLFLVADKHFSLHLKDLTEDDKDQYKETIQQIQAKMGQCRTVLGMKEPES